MSLRRALIGGCWLAAPSLLLNALSLPALAFLIRSLGPEAYGQWLAASALMASIATIVSLGLRGAFVRHIAARPQETESALAEQLGVRSLLAFLGISLGVGLAFELGYPPVVLACVALCGLSLLVNAVGTVLVDVLQAHQQSAAIARMTLLSGVTLTATSVLAAGLGGGPVWVAAAYATGPLLLCVLAASRVSRLCRLSVRISFTTTRAYVYRSRGFATQQLLNGAPTHAEAVLLPRFIGFDGLGVYGAGTLLATRLAVVPDGVYTAAYPMLSRRFAEDRSAALRLSLWVGGVVAFGSLLVAILCALASGPIARLLFPASPDLCQWVMLITIWALPLNAIDSAIGYALNAAGHEQAQARASFPAALCNVLIFLLLLSQLGVLGACIALPARHAVRIVLLGLCCLQLRRPRSIGLGAPFSPSPAA